jgi:hypothetical protein
MITTFTCSENLKLCTDLGSPELVDTVSGPDGVPGVDQLLQKCIANLWRICAGAQDKKVKLVWEFEFGFLFNKLRKWYG